MFHPKINYNSILELVSIYPDLFDSKHTIQNLRENYALIRIDPTQTYVFSSEIRALYHGKEKDELLQKSRINMIEYFDIIDKNGCPNYNSLTTKPVWNLLNKSIYYFDKKIKPSKIFIEFPIERNCEIIIERDILKPDELVDVI